MMTGHYADEEEKKHLSLGFLFLSFSHLRPFLLLSPGTSHSNDGGRQWGETRQMRNGALTVAIIIKSGFDRARREARGSVEGI